MVTMAGRNREDDLERADVRRGVIVAEIIDNGGAFSIERGVDRMQR